MISRTAFSRDALKIDGAREADRIARKTREVLLHDLRRRGLVVALSGGIDSSVVGALCVQAVGPDRVLGLLMPERDSDSETLRLSRLIVESLGIAHVHEDITPALEALGCYRRRNTAIRSVIPEFTDDSLCKIVLPSVVEDDRYRVFSVVVQLPTGECLKRRLPPEAYLEIVAASNFKQRVRKMFEYYHADRLNYAVTGTPNRQEYDQGFFVKQGDGAADIKPIAHLYKTQVYQLAEFLGVPEEICKRPPTTDTYSMPQSQEEFYFSIPYDKMDLCLYGKNNGIPANEVGRAVGLTDQQVERVFNDIENKRRATKHLHRAPILIDPMPLLATA